ncbi:hypothetical protein FACS1894181_13860 [Bacteroidia bacterium]|nr:hypothetical protein FACS189438_1780 [Bacteroidia bacterium]GHV51665.1 hypothetical protein FACS1894181_13860 [Bacteroidia bacterium]
MILEFISIPVVVGICVAGTYGLFELFARRKERLMLIEKLSDRLDASAIEGKLRLPSFRPRFSFSALKGGCLLTGVGLGLLVGFLINVMLLSSGIVSRSGEYYDHYMRGYTEAAYGASVLLFGGIGLILAFVIELKMSKKEKEIG